MALRLPFVSSPKSAAGHEELVVVGTCLGHRRCTVSGQRQFSVFLHGRDSALRPALLLRRSLRLGIVLALDPLQVDIRRLRGLNHCQQVSGSRRDGAIGPANDSSGRAPSTASSG